MTPVGCLLKCDYNSENRPGVLCSGICTLVLYIVPVVYKCKNKYKYKYSSTRTRYNFTTTLKSVKWLNTDKQTVDTILAREQKIRDGDD